MVKRNSSGPGRGRIIVQHAKTGGMYELTGTAKLESSGQELTIYTSMEDGQVWARPAVEFNDGRFVRVTEWPSTCAHEWGCVNDGKHGRDEEWVCRKCGEREYRP